MPRRVLTILGRGCRRAGKLLRFGSYCLIAPCEPLLRTSDAVGDVCPENDRFMDN